MSHWVCVLGGRGVRRKGGIQDELLFFRGGQRLRSALSCTGGIGRRLNMLGHRVRLALPTAAIVNVDGVGGNYEVDLIVGFEFRG